MPNTSKTPALLLAAATLALAACGGDDSSTTAASSATTSSPAATSRAPAAVTPAKSAFVTQAEAVCNDVNAQLRRLGQPIDLRAFAGIGRRAVALMVAARGRLAEIEVPADAQADHAQLVELLDEQIDVLRAMVRAAAANDQQQTDTLAETMTRVNERADAIASRLGLEDCAKD